MKTHRRFYLIFINYASGKEPPETLDINERYLHPLMEAGFSISQTAGPDRAARFANEFWLMQPGDTPYRNLDFVAYMVVNAHTARLVWRKRAGNVRGKWAHWHGNPKHKRPREVSEDERH